MKRTLIALLAAGLLVACSDKKSETTSTTAEVAQPKEKPVTLTTPSGDIPALPEAADTITTASGLQYVDILVGEGSSPAAGNMVSVHYTGWLTSGRKFDSSVDRNQPFKFKLGAGQVIKGWDEGVATMKRGSQRRLILPPQLGYGERGAGGVIPPNATLVFDVQLIDFN
ncbi:MAG: FKBP-type peptidyl-prolyl cis-trans isomerase [Candidatus Delongbacteria bacterium]|nr:FKBP-type peptidyl-prolyl cis-trans isomerase [Candidatus Delongbacteria bacterium]